MKKIILLLFAISAVVLTGCTKKYLAHFHITAKAYYGSQPILTNYSIIIDGDEYWNSWNAVSQNGELDYEFDVPDLKEGLYEIEVSGSVADGAGWYVEDAVSTSVYINSEAWIQKDFTLHLH